MQWGCSLPVACVTVLVEVVDGALLGSAVVASVGVGSPVGSTVLVLVVVLGSKRYEMYTYGQSILLRYAIYP